MKYKQGDILLFNWKTLFRRNIGNKAWKVTRVEIYFYGPIYEVKHRDFTFIFNEHSEVGKSSRLIKG